MGFGEQDSSQASEANEDHLSSSNTYPEADEPLLFRREWGHLPPQPQSLVRVRGIYWFISKAWVYNFSENNHNVKVWRILRRLTILCVYV